MDFSLIDEQKMMGLRGTPHVELFFDNVVLEPLALLGNEGQGFKFAMGKAHRGIDPTSALGHVRCAIEHMTRKKPLSPRLSGFALSQVAFNQSSAFAASANAKCLTSADVKCLPSNSATPAK